MLVCVLRAFYDVINNQTVQSQNCLSGEFIYAIYCLHYLCDMYIIDVCTPVLFLCTT